MCLLLTSSMVDGMGPKVGSVSAPAGVPCSVFQASKSSADKLALADFSVLYTPQRRAVARFGGGACKIRVVASVNEEVLVGLGIGRTSPRLCRLVRACSGQTASGPLCLQFCLGGGNRLPCLF